MMNATCRGRRRSITSCRLALELLDDRCLFSITAAVFMPTDVISVVAATSDAAPLAVDTDVTVAVSALVSATHNVERTSVPAQPAGAVEQLPLSAEHAAAPVDQEDQEAARAIV